MAQGPQQGERSATRLKERHVATHKILIVQNGTQTLTTVAEKSPLFDRQKLDIELEASQKPFAP
jgi:hypothetical protein